MSLLLLTIATAPNLQKCASMELAQTFSEEKQFGKSAISQVKSHGQVSLILSENYWPSQP